MSKMVTGFLPGKKTYIAAFCLMGYGALIFIDASGFIDIPHITGDFNEACSIFLEGLAALGIRAAITTK